MLNDLIPVINKIPFTEHPEHFTIIPLSDLHYGSQEFNEVLWHKTVKKIQDDPDCFCVLVGDLIDNGLKNSITNVYEATCSPGAQKEWLYNELKPIANKILGAVGGNHERRTIKEVDQDPLYDVLVRLGKEEVYRPNICFMRVSITLKVAGRNKPRFSFSYVLVHGNGGGMYIASSANKLQNFAMAIDNIDCLITGHTHKPIAFPVSKLSFGDNSILQKQFVIATAGSFLNYGGYTARKLMVPAANTTTELLMTYHRGETDEKNIKVIQ